MQIIREPEELSASRRGLARGRRHARAGADHGRAARRPYGAGRGGAARAPTRSSRRSSSIRPSSAPNEDLAAYPRREAADAAMLEAGGLATCCGCPTVDDIYPDGLRDQRSRSRASASAGTARPGPAISTASRPSSPSCSIRSGPTSRCSARRISAARGDPPDGRATSTCRSRSSACRPSAKPTASRCRRATPICPTRSARAPAPCRARSARRAQAIAGGGDVAEALEQAPRPGSTAPASIRSIMSRWAMPRRWSR